MDKEAQETLNEYKEQLRKVEEAIQVTENEDDTANLLSLKRDLQQLIDLSGGPFEGPSTNQQHPIVDDDEYALFMAEMQKEGAIQPPHDETSSNTDGVLDLSTLEGMKCRAPHEHTWGDTVYHNALISSVLSDTTTISYDTLQVKVLFTNPTHTEMLPCPYYLDTECKFSDEKCRFSHGKVVLFSSLQEYDGPDFASLETGSFVLVKQADRLWHRGIVRKIINKRDGGMCVIKLDKDRKEVEVAFTDVHPAGDNGDDTCSDSDVEQVGDVDEGARQDFINISLLIAPSDDKLGSWEKYTKGIGSKLMEKMGYVIGTGLGSRGQGRIEPVTAVALPAGQSLDHCMELREKAGGDADLFNVDRKLKRLQRKQEQRNIKNYERERRKKVDVFNFLNVSVGQRRNTGIGIGETSIPLSNTQHRKEIKKESSRNLNVESFKIEQCIKEIQSDMVKLTQAMQRHPTSQASLRKQFDDKYKAKEEELQYLQTKLLNIRSEQSLRSTTRKLTIF